MEHNTQTGDSNLQNVYSDNELATEYPLFASLNKTVMSLGLYISNLLEEESIRHCIVGDIVLETIGADTALGHTMFAVADDQLAAAGALIFATDLVDEEPCTYFHHGTSGGALPGFGYVTKGTDLEPSSIGVVILPASYLHFDMEPNNYAHNTILMTSPRCRLPNKVHYANALIYTIVDKTIKRDEPMIYYLKSILHTFILFLPKSFVGLLPPEDQMFLDLIHKVMLPSARRKLCLEWCKIRRGETTVEEARTRIPRKDLAVAKLKAQHEAKAKAKSADAEKAAYAAKSESEKGYSPVKGKENGVLGVVQPGEVKDHMVSQMETSVLAGKENEALVTVRAGQMENHISTADPISRNDTPE